MSEYNELREYIRDRGGLRVSSHGGFRDRVIDWIVADWPVGCREDQLAEEVMARMAVRLRKKYSSAILTFLLYVVVSQIVKLAIEWFLERQQNRDLMMTYHAKASGYL